MRIVIGSDGMTLGSRVSTRFGRASYYIAYDTQSQLFDVLENNNQHEHELEGEDEHANLRHFLDEDVKAFIVGNIGPIAFKTVKTSATKVYLARKMTVDQSIKRLLNNRLTELTEPTAKRSIGHRKDEKKE